MLRASVQMSAGPLDLWSGRSGLQPEHAEQHNP